MKKIGLVAIVVLFGATSCKKNATVTETSQTVDVTIDANTAYEYDLGNAQNTLISSDASHARISVVTTDPLSSKMTYYYVPDSSYTGSDNVTVVVTSGPDGNCPAKPGCKKPKPDCKKNQGDVEVVKTTYNFNFTVGKTVLN